MRFLIRLRAMPALWFLLLSACASTAVSPPSWVPSTCSASRPALATADGSAGRVEKRDLEMDDGVLIKVGIVRPDGVDCAPLIVAVPPGFDEGLPVLKEWQVDALAASGAAVVAFDPRGRGQSQGEEDINGTRGQTDFTAVLRWASGLDGIDSDAVVIYSRSIGGALVSGALASHADLAPRAWVDVESPGWLREDMDHTSAFTRDRMEALAAASDDEDAWWAEREPANFISGVTVPYHRIQGWPDHALNYIDAAVAMVNGATGSPLVTYNGAEVTAPLTSEEALAQAYGGGVDPQSDLVNAALLAAFEDEASPNVARGGGLD